jgi:hypothetical protein
MKRSGWALVMAALTVATGACTSDGNLIGDITTTASPATSGGTTAPSGDTTTTGATGTTAGDPTGTTGAPATTAAPPPATRPAPIQEGLATFDSYRFRFRVATTGGDEALDSTIEIAYDGAADARELVTTVAQTGPDAEDEPATQRTLTVGNESCSFDGETWSYQAITDQQREFLEATRRLFDITIIPENPALVGTEEVAGIPAAHYRFTLSGLGQESGALVSANDVDYWVAEGTNVLVKYAAIIETRDGPTTDPDAQVFRTEASAELLSADQPIAVELPAECLALRPPEGGGPDAPEPGSDVRVRLNAETLGTIDTEPVCFFSDPTGGLPIGGVVSGMLGGTSYNVGFQVPTVDGPGTYPNGEFTLTVFADDGSTTEAFGVADAVVSLPADGLFTVEFTAVVDGDAGRGRVIGSITCPIE